jgi:hypothetical protein
VAAASRPRTVSAQLRALLPEDSGKNGGFKGTVARDTGKKLLKYRHSGVTITEMIRFVCTVNTVINMNLFLPVCKKYEIPTQCPL